MARTSLATALANFHPRLADHYLHPTPQASWIWQHWPSANDPLPEVFAERLSGFEGLPRLPVAAPGCTKALLAGTGPTPVLKPRGCGALDVPAWCQESGRLCYANRSGNGWVFVRAPVQASFTYEVARQAGAVVRP